MNVIFLSSNIIHIDSEKLSLLKNRSNHKKFLRKNLTLYIYRKCLVICNLQIPIKHIIIALHLIVKRQRISLWEILATYQSQLLLYSLAANSQHVQCIKFRRFKSNVTCYIKI